MSHSTSSPDTPASSAASVIRARGLRKQYGDFHAVKGIDLDVRPGECFGLLGPNGAGKSTVLTMMGRLQDVDSGTIAVNGRDITRTPSRELAKTLAILRQQEETLMTILEAFIYDPTLDLQRFDRKQQRKQQQNDPSAIKLNPQAVVDSIRRKVRGLLPDESIPLGVEGQVEELIKQAVDPRNLTAMYIGWCPFL